MVPASADASLPDSLVDQPRQNGLVIQPISKRSYQCELCTKSFPCHEPLQHHARIAHSHTVQNVYMEYKLSPDIITIHSLYCRRETHYVRVTTSTLLGPFSRIEEIVAEEELTFEEFLKRDFSPTETYKETVRRVKEFDKRCCRPVYTTFAKLVKKLLSCFACIPVPKQSRSRRWPSKPNMRLTSPSQSTETLMANNKRSHNVDDPASTTRNSLPEHVTGIVAVASFFSTADGVHGHEVLVTTRSDTIILLGLVDLDALLQHPRIEKQLQEMIGGHTFAKLLKYRKKPKKPKKPKDTKVLVYQGNLPDDLPIRVREGVRLEDCSSVLQAEVCYILDS